MRKRAFFKAITPRLDVINGGLQNVRALQTCLLSIIKGTALARKMYMQNDKSSLMTM